MQSRLPRLLTAGLILLMAGLFVTAFLLNRNNYLASIGTVDTSFVQLLEQQAEGLRKEIEKQEAGLFSKLENDPLSEPDADLFIVLDNRVVPACTAGLLETVPEAEADTALEKRWAAPPGQTSLSHFQMAARRRVSTPDDLYRKTAALFNLLEIEPDTRTVCSILALLNLTDPALTESQRRFFRSMLEEQVPDLSEIERRASRLWETATAIDRSLTRRKGTYRAESNGKILSVREDGLAVLYSPDIEATAPVMLTQEEDHESHEQIIPGLFASIPSQVVDKAKASIGKQYRTGNIILALMVLLGTTLTLGLFAAAKRQRQLDAMRTDFIATVSHELRTPLSLIRLHAETLKHGRIPEDKVADYHQTILTESERLTGIVNNVLDFSRMERNKLQIHLEPTDLSTLCEQIAESFHFRLEQEGFELERQMESGITANVDPLAYSQIVFNLLDNAIKYSDDEKHIRIELESSNGWNILRVFDRGIGIPDKLKKHIFEEFVRSDDSKVTARRGSGIGLSVAQRLAEKMDGTIEVADNQPKGSVFTVSVPPASSGLQGRQDGGDTIEEMHETIGG